MWRKRRTYSAHYDFADRAAGARRRITAQHFSSAHREALTEIKLSPWYEDWLAYLRKLRPNLTTIESLALGKRDEPFLFEENPHARYPIAFAGDGFRRSLLLAATLAKAKGGVAALDEPEAFAYPRMFETIAALMRRALEDRTQVLISTHSLEFVQALVDAFEDAKDRVAVIGLSLTSGMLNPVIARGEDAYRRIIEHRDDLRL